MMRMCLLFVALALAGCGTTLGVGDKYGNAGVACGTHVGMGFTERIGVVNLDKGVLHDGGTITCAPDGTLTITSGTTPVKAPKVDPVKP